VVKPTLELGFDYRGLQWERAEEDRREAMESPVDGSPLKKGVEPREA
jgi:hypothetical protein